MKKCIKIFFLHRSLTLLNDGCKFEKQNNEFVFECKNKKSFDNVYNEFLNNVEITDLVIRSPKPDKLFRNFKKKFDVIKAAGGLVLNNKKELLVIKRRGVWDLPKGKLEENESKKTAAIREVMEECGISMPKISSKSGKTYHTYQQDGMEILKITYWYLMLYDGVQKLKPQLEEDITEVKWIKKEEVHKIIQNSHNNLVPLFEKFLSL